MSEFQKVKRLPENMATNVLQDDGTSENINNEDDLHSGQCNK